MIEKNDLAIHTVKFQIFEPNNNSLEFFSDLIKKSFGARADINGTKERYHVRTFTIAFALVGLKTGWSCHTKTPTDDKMRTALTPNWNQ